MMTTQEDQVRLLPDSPGSKPPCLVLAARGGGQGSQANLEIEELRIKVQEGWSAPVSVVFQRGTPSFDSVLDPSVESSLDSSVGSGTDSTFDQHGSSQPALVIPLFAEAGYYSRRRLPSAIVAPSTAALLGDPANALAIAPPLGASSELHRQIAEDVFQGLASEPDRTTVLIVGHGTELDSHSTDQASSLAGALRLRAPGLAVAIGFLDQSPSVLDLVSALRSGTVAREEELASGKPNRILVVPWMWGGASHVQTDLVNAMKGMNSKVTILAPLGSRDDLATHIQATASETLARMPLRVGSRQSSLATAQTLIARKRLAAAGCPNTLHSLEERGDLDLNPAIAALGAGAFSDALENELVRGHIDLAVHSLKDLPLQRLASDGKTPDHLRVAAILPRGPAGEVLISKRGVPLADLCRGARVGTSSARRKLQVLHHAPDLEVVPLRGPVDQRVKRVLEGDLDAAVLAEAGIVRLGLEHLIAERFPLPAFLPDAGQGALALQIRGNDEFAAHVCRRVDHAPTRIAVLAERYFAKLAPPGTTPACHAYATIQEGRAHIALWGRILDGEGVRDASAVGDDPISLAHRVVDLIDASSRCEVVAS